MSIATAIQKQDPMYYGLVAEFSGPDEILEAAKRAKAAGYKEIDAFTPFPVHGLDDAIEFRCTKIQWSIFGAAIIGCAVGMGLQYYTSVIDYPMNVGGRPLFSWPSFIPVAYECTILFAALAAVVGTIVFNGLPRPNHPVFNTPRFYLASQTSFFLALEAKDPQFDVIETRKFLESLEPVAVSDVRGDEEVSE